LSEYKITQLITLIGRNYSDYVIKNMVSNIVFFNIIIVIILIDISSNSCVNSNMLKPLTTLREYHGFDRLECN